MLQVYYKIKGDQKGGKRDEYKKIFQAGKRLSSTVKDTDHDSICSTCDIYPIFRF